ncbi:MAG: RHS repeat-associated core domain-containing protein, partial [Acidimicrobiales bacterium]
ENFTWNTLSSTPQLLMDGSNAYIYGPPGTSTGNAPMEQVSLSAPTSESSVTYLISDPEGVRLTFNSSGTMTGQASYDAYGNVIAGGLSNITPFGYAGGYTDPTGLVYLINRYYDPSTGQFVSVDPLVSLTNQPYQYVGGDPVNEVDPLGLWSWNPCNWGNVCHHAHNVLNGTISYLGNTLHTDACTYFGSGGLVGSWLGPHMGCGRSARGNCPSAVGIGGGVQPNFSDPAQPPGPGWEWRGTGPPGSGRGNWFNPQTDQHLYPDLNHDYPKGPHYDYKGPDTDGEWTPIYPGEGVPEILPEF